MIYYFKCFGQNFARTSHISLTDSPSIPRVILYGSEMIMTEDGQFIKSRYANERQEVFKLELKVMPIINLDQLTNEELKTYFDKLKIAYFNYTSRLRVDDSDQLAFHIYTDKTNKKKEKVPEVKKGIHKE